MPTTTPALSLDAAGAPFRRVELTRRDLRADDVLIDIAYAGICHSDIHTGRDEWGAAHYPLTPGHEIAGTVAAVGSAVTGLTVGDRVGVGCLVDSCGVCEQCTAGHEQFCQRGAVGTYNSKGYDGEWTAGGYAQQVVVSRRFVLRIPDGIGLDVAAPLLCAGITTYSPLRHHGITKGKKVGIVGPGGLGHMGVKFARAFGAHVVVITTSPGKAEDAMRLGAHEVVVSRNADEMKKHAGSFDFILDTVPADHDINQYLHLLRLDGNLTLVGVPSKPLALSSFALIFGRRSVSGSNIGGIPETQEMLDFCEAHNITADVEVIPIQKVNEAYDRLLKSDVKYRFSIDMASLKSE